MKLKQITITTCLGLFLINNCQAGILHFLFRHDNTITAGIAALAAAAFFPPHSIKSQFHIPNPNDNEYVVSLMGLIRTTLAAEKPENLDKIMDKVTHIYSDTGAIAVPLMRLVAGTLKYSLVKYYLTPQNDPESKPESKPDSKSDSQSNSQK